jgi:hypothetical protein
MSRGRPIDLLGPLPGFLVLLYLYSLASGLFVETHGTTLFGDPVTPSVRQRFYIVCLIGTAGLALGCLLAGRSRVLGNAGATPERRDATAGQRNGDVLIRNLCWFIGAVFALLHLPDVLPRFGLAEIQSYGETSLESRIVRMDDHAAGTREFMAVYVPVTLLMAAAAMTLVTARGMSARVFSTLVIASYVIANSLAGSRRFVIEALALVLIVLHYRWRRVGLGVAVALGAGVYLFVNVLSIARVSSEPLVMVRAIVEQWQDVGLEFLALSSSGELLTAANLHRLIAGLDAGETEFTLGQSLLDEAQVFIPQTVIENRPLPLAERFVDVFYPGVREHGGGYGLFILQEGYWALGSTGVFVLMLTFGLAVQGFYRWCIQERNDLIRVIVYGLCYGALVLSSVRMGTLAAIKSSLMTVAPFLTVVAIAVLIGRPSLPFGFRGSIRNE